MKYFEALEYIKNMVEYKNLDLGKVVDFLYDNFPHYSWVGIYVLRNNTLILGPWRGEHATEHTLIDIGEGICGAAAKTGETEIIDDVGKDDRYLACFLSTKSEIVVPIWFKKKVVGEIDIDSDSKKAFSLEDKTFLETLASIIAPYVG